MMMVMMMMVMMMVMKMMVMMMMHFDGDTHCSLHSDEMKLRSAVPQVCAC